MTNLFEIIKALAVEGINTSIQYDKDRDQIYADLNTMAKSELHLYENGIIRGRYEYENQLIFDRYFEDVIIDLCYEFEHALHGRDYYNPNWAKLCKNKGISI